MKLQTHGRVSCVGQHTESRAPGFVTHRRTRRGPRGEAMTRTADLRRDRGTGTTGYGSTVMSSTSKDAATRTVAIDGTAFAYREVGPTTGVSVVFLHHFTAGL